MTWGLRLDSRVLAWATELSRAGLRKPSKISRPIKILENLAETFLFLPECLGPSGVGWGLRHNIGEDRKQDFSASVAIAGVRPR
jgi:hypothetical protein